MKIRTAVAAIGVALLTASLGSTAAYADTGGGGDSDPGTIVISGHQLTAADGLTKTTESYEIVPGGGPVGATYGSGALTLNSDVASPLHASTQGVVSPMTAWGASYAYSKEILHLGYVGYAKAAANVYSGQRIVEVCFWYTRGGVQLIPTTCSEASFNGGWNAGAEVTYSVNDTLDPNAPHTIFNISTWRIPPPEPG